MSASPAGGAPSAAAAQRTSALWRPDVSSPSAAPPAPAGSPESLSYYFIDSCKHYRGPVALGTLRMLFSEGVITPRTYVFAEQLADEREWVRIERLPRLLDALKEPVAPIAEESAKDGAEIAPNGWQAPQHSRGSFDVAHDRRKDAAAHEPLDAHAPKAAHAPIVATPRVDVTLQPANVSVDSKEELSAALSAASKPKLASPGESARAVPWYKRVFGKKDKSPAPAEAAGRAEPTKWSFGQPLEEVALRDGVPEVLVSLRQVLWDLDGQLSEGIFRVSPAASDLKAHRLLVESGQFDQLNNVDCVAQLIKLWFKELPQSVFSPQLNAVVDGVPQNGEQCAQVVRQMPELHRRVVRWLLQLFTDVCRHETENRMTATSLTIVFSPNLLDPPASVDPMLSLELNKRMVRFLEKLFDYWNQHGTLDDSEEAPGAQAALIID